MDPNKVRQAFFRFRLSVDTIAVDSELNATYRPRGFHTLDQVSRQSQKNSESFSDSERKRL